jgi:cellulose biosynthesis protein BcsQ
MMRKGYRENEAAEVHTAKVSFPKIPQQKWPSSRVDGRFGHHYHLTQTCFVLVYHILLNFEKPIVAYNSQEITDMTKARFQKMDTKLGELREPIAPLCNSKNDA